MKLSKDEIQAIHLQSQAWAEMRELLPELDRIATFGSTKAGDEMLIKQCVNLVCGEICLKMADGLKDSQT